MSEADPDLRRLIDQDAISDILHRYATGLDARDWALWRSAFCDEVTLDMGSFTGRPVRPAPAERHVEAARRLFAGFDATQHMITNHRHTIDGDTAGVVAHMRAEHWADGVPGGDRFTMFGYYDDELTRTTDGWRLHRVRLVVTRTEGNRAVIDGAAARGRS